MRMPVVAAFVAALSFAPTMPAQIIVGRQCKVSALPQNSNPDDLRKLTGRDEPFQIETCTWGTTETKTYAIFTKPEALIEGVCRYRSQAIYPQGMRDGYLKWSNIPPPAMASGGGLKTLERTPGHQSAYLAVGKAPCPPPGDVSYVGTMDIPTKKFVEIMSLWKAITATEASFTKFFGGEDVVAKSKPLTAVRNRLFLSRHPQDQRVISSIEREKFGLMDWIIPTYGISIGFDDDGASYAIIVRDGIGGLSFQRIDEAIY